MGGRKVAASFGETRVRQAENFSDSRDSVDKREGCVFCARPRPVS
jgi:hypothetical protein